MENLKVFESKEFGNIRTVMQDGEPWFVGKDIASALGYAKERNAIANHVEKEDKKDAPIQGDLGGTQQMTIINESGMYALIFGSKLESAKKFKRWVTSEVLPEIRKTGSYQKALSPVEQLKLQKDAIVEVSNRVDKLENDMPLLGVDMDRIVTAVNRKVVSLLGGKDANAYKDKSLRGKVYHDAYEQLKREFGVSTYKAIKRCQLDSSLAFIKDRYVLPMALKNNIAEANS